MAMSGKIEEVGVEGLLRLAASRRLSGKLVLHRRGGEAVILLRRGNIVAAVSSDDPQTIGSLLLSEGHINERELHTALELQRQSRGEERLPRVLERMGAVSAVDLEQIVRRKIEQVIEGLRSWTSGYFELGPASVASQGEVEIDPAELLGPGDGDDLRRPASDLRGVGDLLSSAEPVDADDQRPATAPLESAPLLGPVPVVTGEATSEIVEAAREELSRGVLFVVRNGAFSPIATFGLEESGVDTSQVRRLAIPEEAPSVLRDGAEHGEVMRTELDPTDWNRELLERLGGRWPREALLGAVQAMGRTLLVLYGDQLPEERPVGPTPRLEAVLAEVALKLEGDSTDRRRARIQPVASLASSIFPDAPPEPGSLAGLSGKLDRLLEQNEALIREFRAREQTLWHAAHHDSLTGLPNRFLFRELLAKELAHARQDGTLVTVSVIDIDHFKDLNDRFGETFGDDLLAEVAQRVSGMIRAEDTLARLESDRFALVVPRGRTVSNPMLVVRRLFDAFAEPFSVGKHEVRLSISMGISFYPSDGRVPGELILNAESALRRAKESGRNKFEVFVPSMNEWAQVRMELVQDLRHAVTKGEDLALLFQPILASDSGRIVGGEALVRWAPAGREAVEPRVLVELAEDTGLMPALGEWVLRHACHCVTRWLKSGVSVPVNVNVSIRQFQAEGLVETVMRALTDTDLPPELLQLEITESIAALNEPKIHDTLERLDKLGVKVVLDDFGAGYSSLSYLMRYSVTGLKVDRSFVAALPDSAEARAVVEAAIGLGRNLGLQVVGEGVENAQHLSFLRKLGCPFVQGHHLRGPVSTEEFEELLHGGGLVPRAADESR